MMVGRLHFLCSPFGKAPIFGKALLPKTTLGKGATSIIP